MDDLDQDLLDNQIRSSHQKSIGGFGSQGNDSLATINIDLFNRLLKTSVLKANPNIQTIHEKGIAILDDASSEDFNNGMMFANYLIVLKQVLQKENQDFAIDSQIVSNLKNQPGPQSRLFNWNFLCTELDVSYFILF